MKNAVVVTTIIVLLLIQFSNTGKLGNAIKAAKGTA